MKLRNVGDNFHCIERRLYDTSITSPCAVSFHVARVGIKVLIMGVVGFIMARNLRSRDLQICSGAMAFGGVVLISYSMFYLLSKFRT